MIITIYSPDPGTGLPEERKTEDRPVLLAPEIPLSGPLLEKVCREERLHAIPDEPGKDASVIARLFWWLRWLLGIGPREETFRGAKRRIRSMAEDLVRQDEACVLAASPAVLELLLRALRRKGFVVHRSHMGFVRHGEKIFLSQRKDHCGGCGHNCLLQNPGCGVGRDIMRRGR